MKVHLPVDDYLSNVTQALLETGNLIIVAAPGAGKTTRVPPALISVTSKKILMLQPRRIAARASAERIAQENQWKLGSEVGYRVRFEDCTSPSSRLVIVTEALLMRELLRDPDLSEYGIVILDEFHERNLYSDAGLGALRELQQLSRPDLKIVVMSATLDADPLQKYLHPAAIINVPGRTFPVEVVYDQQAQALNTDRNFIERVSAKVLEAMKRTEENRHILVFLPGLSEIQRVKETLDTKTLIPKHRRVVPLHGSLALDEQQAVLQSNEPKVILSTNVAETSLTIDGVNTVIDSGLARELQNDQRRLFPWLKTIRISRASAEQRKGRAGRQYPGLCYRLWNRLDEQSMPAFAPPDIATQELSELLLMLCQLGVSDPQSFSWFEPPPAQNLERARSFLITLKLLELDGNVHRLTQKGQWIQRLPLPPRLGALVFESVQKGQSRLGAQIAALLNERDPWNRETLESWQSGCLDSDLIPRLSALNQSSPPREFHLVDRLAQQLCRQLGERYQKQADIKLGNITNILLASFPDRITRRRRPKDKAGLVIGQKGVELSVRSLVRDADFFLSLAGHANESNGNAIVDLAHPVTKATLLEQFSDQITQQKTTRFMEEKDAWMSVEQKFLGDLPIEEPNYKPLEMNSETLNLIAQESFNTWKTTDPNLMQWFQRVNLAQSLWPDLEWPELLQWQRETVEMACMGETSLQAVREKKWEELFCLPLENDMKKLLLNELPASILSPRGRRFTLIYEQSGAVSVEMKIQDAFGWQSTPTLAQGRIRIRLILLGPHMRPLQTTDDLASFWRGTYRELRPSLKARYPKHQWPEDPSQL